MWPENVAPFTHILIVIGDHMERAQKLAIELESKGARVLLDDRNAGFGQKATDADLFGIPNRIILSDKTTEKGGYELKKRNETEGIIIAM
jgi:prolyl-tRNA synthetase